MLTRIQKERSIRTSSKSGTPSGSAVPARGRPRAELPAATDGQTAQSACTVTGRTVRHRHGWEQCGALGFYGHSPQAGGGRSEPPKKAAFAYPNQSSAGSEIPPCHLSKPPAEEMQRTSSKIRGRGYSALLKRLPSLPTSIPPPVQLFATFLHPHLSGPALLKRNCIHPPTSSTLSSQRRESWALLGCAVLCSQGWH